jgi:general secretion pathway protein D
MCQLVTTVSLAVAPALARAEPARGGPAMRTPPRSTGDRGNPADVEQAPAGGDVDFNLDDADLPALVKAVGNITGRRFLYGDKLRSIKATVHSPQKISAGEAYRVFLSILQTNGMTVIRHGRFFKIVESNGVAGESTEIYGPEERVPNEDRYVTRIHRLAHADPAEVTAVLTKLKSKDGDIAVHAPGNLLVITDTGAHIHRMLDVLAEIDVPSAERKLWVQPVHYVSPSQIAAKLTDVLDLGRAEGGRSGLRLVADDRSGSLVIAAGEADYLRILELVNRLDTPPSAESEIRVLRLQHATCKDLSQTLGQILGTGASPAARGPGPIPGAAGAGVDDVFDGRVRLTCDEALNAVVTTASARDQATIRTVIEKLDRPRRQVFIEATIMDVNLNGSKDVGVSYHAGSMIDSGSAGQSLLYGGNDLKTSMASVPANVEGLVLGLRGPQIPGAQNILGTGLSIPTFGMVFSAVEKSGDANVLATPHILATDNVKAEISIGQNIPLQTNVNGSALAALAGQPAAGGLAASLGSSLGSGGNGQRQDVGTKLSLTPHINASNQVRIELVEEISEAGDPQGNLGAIPIQKRTASTTLVVRDQQTVIIGGLMRDAEIQADTKIPVLGDIPVLGFLFKQSSKKKQRTNLLLVLTPYIVRDQEDLRAIFERKMQERQEIIDRYVAFSDIRTWTPPKDYRRANGLVEDIRQSMLVEETKRQAEIAAQPAAPKTHAPVAPIARPAPGRGQSVH